MISIVLIEPEVPGNIGAIARSMGNFDFKRLILVKPNCNHLSDEARNRAKWANRILRAAEVIRNIKQLRKDFDYIIGTTGRLGSDSNITRTPLLPPQLVNKISTLPKNKKIAIVFGREGDGLNNKEINLCDFITTIPTSTRYSSLNLSHAANIILYELSRLHSPDNENKTKITQRFIMADRKDRDQLHKMFNSVLDTIDFPTFTKKETQKTAWRRILEKSLLTKRESRALMGFFAQLKKQRHKQTAKKTTKKKTVKTKKK